MPSSVIGLIAYYAATQAGLGVIFSAIIAAAVTYAVSSAFAKDGNEKNFTNPNRSQTLTIRDSKASWKVIYGKVRVGGVVTYMESTNNNGYLHMVITIACHQVEEIDEIWFNDEVVPLDGLGNATGKYAGYVHVQKNLGSDDQIAFSHLVSESAGKWTPNDKQSGHAGVYIRLIWNNDLFVNGLPNITAVIRGRNQIYDPRTGLTGYSSNAALCLADYLTNSKFGFKADYEQEIDADELITSANICDEDVALLAGGTEKRYACNGIVDTVGTRGDIISHLLSSMAGTLVYSGGRWKVRAGAFSPPSFILTEDDIVGPIKTTILNSYRDLWNSVKGTYFSPENNWQPSDFPSISVQQYVDEDDGEVIWKDINLPYTTSAETSQRLAKIVLERNRRQLSVAIPCKLRAYQLDVGDIVMLTFERYGFHRKTFEVISCALNIGGDTLSTDLSLRDIDAGVYAWDPTFATEVLPTPATTLPDPFSPAAPGVPTITETLYETSGSAGVKTKVRVDWAHSADQFVEFGGSYQLEYQVTSGTLWIVAPNLRSNSMDLQDVRPGPYTFKVKALNIVGAQSPYATTNYTVVGLAALPTGVNSFSVRPSNGFAHFTWALHDDLDVRIGGVIEIRLSSAASLANVTWSDSNLIDRFSGGAVAGVGPLITGYYLAKAEDSTLHYSNSAALFYADEALLTGFTTVQSVVEAPSFTGSKNNLSIISNVLELTNPTSNLLGTYYFPNAPFYIDCGSIAPRRYEADVTITRFDANDLISLRGPVAAWPSITGGKVDRGNSILYAQMTNDHPGSGPVWTAWTPMLVADFNSRAARFKMEFVSESATYNVGVSVLNVHIKKAA